MKFTKPLLSAALLFASTSIAFAATDSTTVQINVTEGAYVTLVGTALNSANDFTKSDLAVVGTSHGLGTLGFDTNVTGNCILDFNSANGYKLNHNVTAATLVDYKVSYEGTDISDNVTNTVTRDCATALPTALNWASTTALPATVAAGTYSDTVTITVTTP